MYKKKYPYKLYFKKTNQISITNLALKLPLFRLLLIADFVFFIYLD